jgi:hypothetical protein
MVGVITHQLLQNNIKKININIMGCINKLTAAVSYDCTNVANRAKSGLEAKLF